MKHFTQATRHKDIKRNWHLFDLKGKILGRIATDIAVKLMGKNKPYFVPHLDCGDYVVVVNSKAVEVTGDKRNQKIYQHFSGYPGGIKRKPFKQIVEENPNRIIEQAVSGMLPKNKLRDQMLKRLYVFPDSEHPYQNKFNQT